MPLQLACNYSQPLLSLLERGAADVDWIKLSDPQGLEADLAVARPLRPVLLHNLGRAGRRPEEWDGYPWEALNRQLTTAGSPHIALHLDLWAEDWEDGTSWQRESRAQSMAVLRRLADGIRTAQWHLHVPILVENVPYYGPGSWRPRITIDPEALWQLVEETGAGVLLDVAHLRCTAYTLGVEVRAYTRALPLQGVRELHVGGPRMVAEDGLLHDRHQELAAEDWALLEWVLGEVSPGIVTLEYGGTGPAFEGTGRNDPEALERQLGKLREVVGAKHRCEVKREGSPVGSEGWRGEWNSKSGRRPYLAPSEVTRSGRWRPIVLRCLPPIWAGRTCWGWNGTTRPGLYLISSTVL